uniref:SAM-dependent MTase RsmB/NOP-type domain-containing protein n=1 Tax=Aureoumbra lagunensis TaxID=44058 RepID=A0A7S3JNK2_9STRA
MICFLFSLLFACVLYSQSLSVGRLTALRMLTYKKIEEEIIDDREKGLAMNLLRMSERRLGEIDQRLLEFYKDNDLLWWRRLDEELPAVSKKNRNKKKIVVNALRLGTVQLLFFDEEVIPQRVAIHETVEITKRMAGLTAGRIVNGVLRNLQRSSSPYNNISSRINCSPWFEEQTPNKILDRYLNHHAIYRNETPGLDLTFVNSEAAHQQIKLWTNKNATILPLQCNSVRNWGIYNLFASSNDENRLFWAQDAAATVAVSAFPKNLLPKNASILDACAAPGGKTLGLAWSHQFQKILAIDADSTRLTTLRTNLETVALPSQVIINTLVSDALELTNHSLFDAVLLDVPCSSSGTARRQPEVLRKMNFGNLLERQFQLLHACLEYLKPGGILVYSTCSIFPQENHMQINRYLNQNPQHARRLPFSIPPNGFQHASLTQHGDWQILPWHLAEYDEDQPSRFDCDAHYVARLQKL